MDRPPVAFEIVTGPGSEPVTLQEAKDQCRVSGTDEDSTLTGLISVARELVEIHTERALITQTRRMWIDSFPRGCVDESPASWQTLNSGQILRIPFKPITAVSLVEYVDPAGDWQTVDDATYVVDLASAPARLQPVYGQMWPLHRIQINAVKITFVCGGANAAAVPAIAKHAMKLLIGHWFENREAVGKVPAEIALGYWPLVNALRWH